MVCDTPSSTNTPVTPAVLPSAYQLTTSAPGRLDRLVRPCNSQERASQNRVDFPASLAPRRGCTSLRPAMKYKPGGWSKSSSTVPCTARKLVTVSFCRLSIPIGSLFHLASIVVQGSRRSLCLSDSWLAFLLCFRHLDVAHSGILCLSSFKVVGLKSSRPMSVYSFVSLCFLQ